MDNLLIFLIFLKWFCPLHWKTEKSAKYKLAEYGFRYGKQNGQNGNGQGERVEIFQRSVLKNTTRPLPITKRGTSARPLAEVAEGGFLVSPFSEKKVKVLRV